MPPVTAAPETVIIHPLVLLSVVDHYLRVAENTKKRVVGVLLGKNTGKTVDITNCYAVPFEEDEKESGIWFLDHNYLESMWQMYKKINASEKIVGWYHSGPKLRSSDLEINELMKRYTPAPVLVVIDVEPDDSGIPTNAYFAVEEIHDDGTTTSKNFAHIHSEIQAEEAEEVGVEHLLRDIKDNVTGTLSSRIGTSIDSLRGLHKRLADINSYLSKVVAKELPVNHSIIYNLQNIFNLLPNLSATELARAFTTTSNDRLLVVYLASLVRSIIALHQLIDNKIENRESEKEKQPVESEKPSAETVAPEAGK